jgi:hypothetical protein
MLTTEGAALIAEVVATAWLVIALVGFNIRRTTPWLVCAAVAALLLLSTVMLIVDATGT